MAREISEYIKYKTLKDVGRDFVDILRKNKSVCSYKELTVANEKLKDIRCKGEKENLSILYYPETGEIHEVINIPKAFLVKD